MREMTRPEFETYEKRVEAVLATVEQTLDASERGDFDEVAAAAREVVDIRREYLELTEQQVETERADVRRADEQRADIKAQWDAAVGRHGRDAVETAIEVLVEIEHYREGLSRIEAGALPQSYGASYNSGLAREVHRAAELAVDDGNQYIREVAKSDQELQRAIELVEMSRDNARGSVANKESERPGIEPDPAIGQPRGSAGDSPGVMEGEKNREADHNDQLDSRRDEHRQDRSLPDQPRRRSDERETEKRPTTEVEAIRSDPPQQHIPRLRQIELELEERHDRDDRER